MPLNLRPKHFPTNAPPAARLIIAVAGETIDDALALASHFMSATWVEEADIAAPETLKACMRNTGLDAGHWLPG